MHFIRRYWPLLVFLSFSASTIVLFFYGPVDYEVSNVPAVVVYLVGAHLAVIVGYRVGLGQPWGVAASPTGVRRWGTACAVMSSLYIVAVLRMNAVFGISVDTAIEAPGLARGIGAEKIGTFYSYLTSWLDVLNISFVCLLFALWRWLRGWHRVVGGVLFIVLIGEAVAMGARHAIWAILFVAFTALHIGIVSGRLRVSRILYVGSFVGVICSCFLYFSFIALARSGYEQSYDQFESTRFSELETSRLMFVGKEKIDQNHPLIRYAPAKLSPAILQGYSYLTHGYKALAMALDKRFIGIGWGFGHAAWTTRLGVRLFGDGILKYSYANRLYEEDQYPLTKWITSYPWIASDVTFPGSVVVLCFFGWLLGASWRASVTMVDPLAIFVCCYVSLCLNQMPIMYFAQDPATEFIFTLYIVAFIVRRAGGQRAPRHASNAVLNQNHDKPAS